MTSKAVAAQVTLTPQYVRLIECGGAVPSMPTVLAICNLFPGTSSADWLWLLLADLWGPAAVEVMREQARRSAGDGEALAARPGTTRREGEATQAAVVQYP